MKRYARSAAALLALLVALLLGGAGVASAHAALLSTDPAQGSVVAVPPTAVTLHFSESVTLEPDALRVFDPSGKRVDTGTAGHASGDASTAQVRIDASAAAAQGTYTVAWRVISADTHPVAGAFTFSIGRSSAPATLTGVAGVGDSGPTATGSLYGLTRGVQYGAMALLVGSVGAVLLCWPGGLRLRGVQRLMIAGWAGLLLSTLAELALRGTYEAGTGLGKVFDLSLLRQVLGEKLGVLLAVRVLLLAGAGVFLALLGGHAHEDESGALVAERRRRIGLGVTGALLSIAIAVTWPLGDHASVGMQVPLAVTLDTVHILSMSLWLGGLATVLVGLRALTRAGGIDVRAVGRFSTLAFWCVAALTATGVYQAWRGLGSWSALTDTTYGRLLLVKIGAVLVILGAAWMSRRWLALLRADASAEDATGSAEATEVLEAEAGAGTGVVLAEVSAAARGGEQTAERAADAVGVGDTTDPADPAGADADADPDPERAAQLARQARARQQARQRKAREAAPARGMLLRSVALEAVFAVVVLGLTTALTNSPPGRAVAEQQAVAKAAAHGPVDVTLPYDTTGSTRGAKGKVTIDIDPARPGQNTLHAYLYDSTGKPVDVPEIDIALSLKSKNLGPLAVKLDHLDIGHWGTADLELPLAGQWTLAVTVRSDDIDEATVTTPVTVG
ncbi:copper resistance CopC/CopD family protein [Streptacidiphilus anmyonensis]|uniref:copper resistance CopC/CopD family protein n=1 Tax=Streptacidiphilus anmyonensis TaxID=405782 RepID=UPI0005A62D82|nr:copper resistance protein CopC [Streptacidiphilus anmyonensis]